MKIFIIGLIVVTLFASLIFLYRHYYIKRGLLRLSADKHKVLRPLILSLARKYEIKEDEILQMAKNPSLRLAVYQTLKAYQREDLFPLTFLTREKGAESYLVTWLEFPTELGASPSEIVFDSLVTIEGKSVQDYYAYKYRILKPHWAAQYNWMWGVSGPYHLESKPFDSPGRVFSRFNQVRIITAEDEVEWVHRNIGK